MKRLLSAPSFTSWVSVVLMVALFIAGASSYTGFGSPRWA
jgi:galactofuranose transport system permease protein